ncbi:MAG TPA: hypothetical protein VKJ47_12235 [Candidatus Binatia bacterium]|nr:hypothetical protein [Candidatus Binatia bacterium]
MLFVSVPEFMARRRIFVLLLLIAPCLSACVTRTERVAYYPHVQPEEESVWDELRHEFGWQKTPQNNMPQDPFYQRAARSVAKTFSGWFHEKDVAPVYGQKPEERHSQSEDAEKLSEDMRKLQESHRQFQQRREEALRRLREQQGQQGLSNE